MWIDSSQVDSVTWLASEFRHIKINKMHMFSINDHCRGAARVCLANSPYTTSIAWHESCECTYVMACHECTLSPWHDTNARTPVAWHECTYAVQHASNFTVTDDTANISLNRHVSSSELPEAVDIIMPKRFCVGSCHSRFCVGSLLLPSID